MNKPIFEQLTDHYGTLAALAARFDLVPMAVSQWKQRGVPVKYCPAIEADTHGKITCHALRPDVFPAPKAAVA